MVVVVDRSSDIAYCEEEEDGDEKGWDSASFRR